MRKRIAVYFNPYFGNIELEIFKNAYRGLGVTLVPIFSEAGVYKEKYTHILLSGGNDIHPRLYFQSVRGSRNVCPERDLIEWKMFHIAHKEEFPILGICRGMQMMNVALGGTLIQEISTISSIPHSYSQHELVWNTHTVFPNRCNSRHHQCLDAIAKGIIVVARSVDGIPEVIFGRKMFGIQSHPENDAKWREVFTWHTENFALDT